MPESAQLLIERPRDGVLRLTINDPQRRNPLSTSVFRALGAEVSAVAANIRVVVLTGAGDEAFASGADLSELGQGGGEGLGGGLGKTMEAARWRSKPVPRR